MGGGRNSVADWGCAVPDNRFVIMYWGVRLLGKHMIIIIDVCFHFCAVVKAGWRVRPKWNVLWHRQLTTERICVYTAFVT